MERRREVEAELAAITPRAAERCDTGSEAAIKQERMAATFVHCLNRS